jgi:putative DNA primase/helicase
VTGCYFSIGNPKGADALCIAEGFATGATIHEVTGYPVAVTFNAGNLLAVAQTMRGKFPDLRLIVCADDDIRTVGNPGITKATEAARSVNGLLAIPDFGNDRPDGATDFNDMAVLCGAEAVQKAIASAKAPANAEHQASDGNAAESVPDGWPEPLPIPCTLLPVEAFDNELLPLALRAWVVDIAERMQCPPDFPAVGAMVALSSVIGRKASIKPKRFDDWQVVPNLWGAIVGRPGVMKSPALSEVMRPLDRLAIIAGDLHAEAMRDHNVKAQIEGMSGKAAETSAQKLVSKGKINEATQLLTDAADAEAIEPPALRRYKVTDASVEALGEILIENPWGTLAYRDELNGLLRSLDKEGQEGARAFYLQGYDGNQGYTFDRIMRGRNLHIPAVCIAMLGGIQPGKLQSYIHDAVSGGAGDDGLLQRFGLLVWPDVCGEWRNVDRWPDTPAKGIAFDAFQRLDALAPGTDPESGEEAPVVYRFTDDAQSLFEEWRQGFETDLRSGDHHPAMESHLSKYRKLVPALALVCALADGEAVVSHASLLRALAWSDYLLSHAKRAYAAGTRPATEGAAALLNKIKAGAVADGFKPADVYLKGWAHLSTPDDTHAASRMLCDLHHLRLIEKRPGAAGGRPSITFQINPATMGGG